jgi:thiol-disulfide isomerase/thioredoxin
MKVRFWVLYASLALCANAGLAADTATLEALRTETMLKLVFSDPVAAGDAAFTAPDGTEAHLSDYAGKVVLVNFWATWCAPCRKEMPGLADLQKDFGGADFQVLTIATGRNPEPAMTRFFDEIGVTNLPLARDPKMVLSRQMGVLGLPASVILDRQGREIARLRGDADWSGASARAIIAALIRG